MVKKIPGIVLSLFLWILVLVSVLILFPVFVLVWALTASFDPPLKILHAFSGLWASLYYYLNPFWKIEIRGREHLPDKDPCVYVANHQSYEDILALYTIFKQYKWVSKAEIFKLPVFGWIMYFNRYIKLERGSKKGVFRMLKTARDYLEKDSSIMIFPEGTRTPDGEIKRFKTGAFFLALDKNVPIVPIVLYGTSGRLIEKNAMIKGAHRVILQILPSFNPSSQSYRDEKEFAELVREEMKNALQKLKE